MKSISPGARRLLGILVWSSPIIAVAAAGMFLAPGLVGSGRIGAALGVQPAASPAAGSPTAALSYELTIAELGVRLPLPPSLDDIKYTVDSKSVPGTTFVYLSTQALEAQSNNSSTRCTSKDGALGAIWKITSDPKTIPQMHVDATKQIGSDYFVYQEPQSGCSSNPATLKLQKSGIESVKTAVNDLSLVN